MPPHRCKHTGYSLGKQRLSGSGRAYHEDIGLLEFDSVLRLVHQIVVDSFVMVVYGNRQLFLSPVLTDHILVEESLDFSRFLECIQPLRGSLDPGFFLDILEIALGKVDTIAAYTAVDSLQHERDFILSPAAESAYSTVTFLISHVYFFFLVRISSTMP